MIKTEKGSVFDAFEMIVNMLMWYAKKHKIKTSDAEIYQYTLEYMRKAKGLGIITKWHFWLSSKEINSIIGNGVWLFGKWKGVKQSGEELVEEIVETWGEK